MIDVANTGARAARLDAAERAEPRWTRMLSALLSARSVAPATPVARAVDAARTPQPVELAERESARQLVNALVAHGANTDWLSELTRLPAALAPAPGRLLRCAELDAAGFADREADSVGVDIACWRTPPAQQVDEHAWRRVFAWLIVADSELSRVAVLAPPTAHAGGVAARYGYEADGVEGVGVLHVAPLSAGRWRIVDCWGDACDAARVQALADALL